MPGNEQRRKQIFLPVILLFLLHVSLLVTVNYLNNINFILSHTILVVFSQYDKHYQNH